MLARDLLAASVLVACSGAGDEPVPTNPLQCVDAGCHRIVVAAGPFTMGCNEALDDQCDADERPPHEVTLPEFHLDRTEVAVAQYRACVKAGACTEPIVSWADCNSRGGPERDAHPMNCVNRAQAAAYCAAVGGRLPTEAEWEKAARGSDLRVYPWGNAPPDCDRTNFSGCHGGTIPVGSLPAGASAYGALDMAGNVLEWVSDWHGADYYAVSPAASPPGPETGEYYVARGGSYAGFPRYVRCSIRDPYLADDVPDTLVGIRCAYDAQGAASPVGANKPEASAPAPR